MEISPKKVILVSSDSNRSGVPKHVLFLAREFTKKGIKATVVAPQGILHESLAKEGIDSVQFKSQGELREIFKSSQDGVFHFHGSRAGLWGSLASRGLKNKKIYTEHNWTHDYELKQQWRKPFHMLILKFIAGSVDKIICVSKTVKEFYLDKNIAPESKLTVVYNGVEYSDDLSHKTIRNHIILGAVGSLVKRKGIDLIIKALAYLKGKEILLKIVGTGEDAEQLHKLTEQLNLTTNVLWEGDIEDVTKFWPEIDIFIQASYDESFGMALASALASGIPVIASDAGATREVMSDSELLFERGNELMLYEKLKVVLLDLGKYKRRAQERRDEYRQKFSIEKMIEQTLEVYR